MPLEDYARDMVAPIGGGRRKQVYTKVSAFILLAIRLGYALVMAVHLRLHFLGCDEGFHLIVGQCDAQLIRIAHTSSRACTCGEQGIDKSRQRIGTSLTSLRSGSGTRADLTLRKDELVVPDDRVDGPRVNFREQDALVPELVQFMSHFVRQMDKLPLGQRFPLGGSMLHRILQPLDGLCIEQWRTAVGYLD